MKTTKNPDDAFCDTSQIHLETIVNNNGLDEFVPSETNLISNQNFVPSMTTVCDSESNSGFTGNNQETIETNTSNTIDKDCDYKVNTNYKHGSRYTNTKYSRSERRKRKREKAISGQTLISSYVSVINKIACLTQKIAQDNNEVREQIVQAQKYLHLHFVEDGTEVTTNVKSTNKLLQMLLDAAMTNCQHSKQKNIFNNTIKQFSLYLLYTGGRLLYETVYANMKNILPSISTLNRFVGKSSNIDEGVFDYDGLLHFLEERDLPKVVWISEDGTRVTGKIEYDQKSNKLVGFVLPLKKGIPQTDSFIARSAKFIQDCFKNENKSNYAYIIMVQPLFSYAPSFCLAIFGTDNRFTANDVLYRWENIKLNLEKRGIVLLGISSDGDTRLMKAMRQKAELGNVLKEHKIFSCDWFNAGYTVSTNEKVSVSYIQDTVHIATKLRTRLLNPKVEIVIGNKTASPQYLKYLINNFSKDKHLLTEQDLKLEDKMNFKAAEKMCSNNVINLLKTMPDTEATCAYLNIMNLVTSSFLAKELDIEKRLYNLWYCVFFVRIWRKWIKDNNKYSLANNFITTNCYVCIELNAHALINVIVNIRNNPHLSKNIFLPNLFSSQTCEKTFRTIRSMTSTYSTVVNLSIKGILQRLKRINCINSILNDLRDVIVFPREEKCGSDKEATDNQFKSLETLINDDEIKRIVERALSDAVKSCELIGINNINTESYNNISVPPVIDTVFEEEEIDEDVICSIDDAVNHSNIQLDIDLPENDLDNDICKDLCELRDIGGEELLLKNFASLHQNNDIEFEKGAFVKINLNSKSLIIKKSSLCWLLDAGSQRVSSDRLQRFLIKNPQHSTNEDSVKKRRRIIAKKPTKMSKTRLIESSSSCDFSSSESDTDTDYSEISGLKETQALSFYTVYYDERWYLGQKKEVLSNNKFSFNFLKKYKNSDKKFMWPKLEDVAEVDKEFIFYGPVNFVNDEEPFEITDVQLAEINKRYLEMKALRKTA